MFPKFEALATKLRTSSLVFRPVVMNTTADASVELSTSERVKEPARTVGVCSKAIKGATLLEITRLSILCLLFAPPQRLAKPNFQVDLSEEP